jgi:hypothetical protein
MMGGLPRSAPLVAWGAVMAVVGATRPKLGMG